MRRWDYHQKYRLRHESKINDELHAVYPSERDFVNSTATMRLNGYLDGHGSKAQFETEVDKLGLSTDGIALLRKHLRQGHPTDVLG